MRIDDDEVAGGEGASGVDPHPAQSPEECFGAFRGEDDEDRLSRLEAFEDAVRAEQEAARTFGREEKDGGPWRDPAPQDGLKSADA